MGMYEQMIRRRNAEIYNTWNVVDPKGLKQRFSKKIVVDEFADFNPKEEAFDEYEKRKKKERQIEKEDFNNKLLENDAKLKYGMRYAQLDPQVQDILTQERREKARKAAQARAFFAEKSILAREMGAQAKDITLREVLEERLKKALNDADMLEVMMNKTYDYHHRAMYERKLEQKKQTINKIRQQLQELELKKLPGAFAANMQL